MGVCSNIGSRRNDCPVALTASAARHPRRHPGVAGERVRLQGIDAPELHQTCTAYGREWPCGWTSAEWLKEYLRGRQAECVGHARDRYGRLLAVCYVGG